MPDEFFTAAAGDPHVLWSGHCAVAEYAFEEPNSLPRWTLPEETEVVITDDRVVYRDVATGAAGELHWPWPQHLRVQPGNRATGRAATVTQIQLVCAGPGGTFPALVFAGGDLATVGDADRLANVLRQAIARYRVEHAAELGISADQVRMLSRLVIGPEFANYQGGEGQTVTLLGSVAVDWPVGYAPEPLVEEPFLDPYAGGPGWPAAGGTEFDGLDTAAAFDLNPAAMPHAAAPGAFDFDPTAMPHAAAPGAFDFDPAAMPHAADHATAPGAFDFDAAAARHAFDFDPAAAVPHGAPHDFDAAAARQAFDFDATAAEPHTGFQGRPGFDSGTAAAADFNTALRKQAAFDSSALLRGHGNFDSTPLSAFDSDASPTEPQGQDGYGAGVRPAFDPTAPPQPRPADEASMRGTSDLAARAAELAARVAGLVAEGTDLGRYEPGTSNLSSYLGGQPLRAQPVEAPAEDRAEKIRRTAARLATNSARGRTVRPRGGDDEPVRRRP
jgi:hypothetical protein